MRVALPFFMLVPLMGSGCTAQCSAATLLGGRAYEIFANPVSFTIDNAALTDSPDFYSYTAPNNGISTWTFKWGGSNIGPIDVIIDGQTFAGTGDWDEVECGHAILDFEGTYVHEATQARHTFSAGANLTVWQDKIGGLLIWNEAWELENGESGTWKGSSHLDGTLTSGV